VKVLRPLWISSKGNNSYRGVFGSHLANVLRRLQRVCAFYGASPQFILCSAIIGNLKDHAEALLEAQVHAITDSGAPSGDKHVLLWHRPVLNPDLGCVRRCVRSPTATPLAPNFRADFSNRMAGLHVPVRCRPLGDTLLAWARLGNRWRT
jgi:hypothetical protein